MMPARSHRADLSLVVIAGVLLMIGLVVIYSISPILSHKLADDAGRNIFTYGQLVNIAVATAAFVIVSRINWRRWEQWLPWVVGAALISSLLLFIPQLAIDTGGSLGATRWLGIGSLSFQPAELMKFATLLVAASWFAKLSAQDLKDTKKVLWPSLILLAIISMFVLIHQKDMGTMLVVTAIVIGVFFVSGASLKQLGALLGIGTAFGLLNIVLLPHRLERVLTFMNPDSDLSDSGYHLYQSLIAVGSGGLFGLGLGKSVQVYGYLPEVANDSIFAIIAETFGFVGAGIVIALFGLLIYRLLENGRYAPDKFSQFLCVGLAVWIGSQALLNISAMLGIVPLTGITLPFISYGGSSLLFVMIAMGIVVNISRNSVRRSRDADRLKRRRYGRAYSPARVGR